MKYPANEVRIASANNGPSRQQSVKRQHNQRSPAERATVQIENIRNQAKQKRMAASATAKKQKAAGGQAIQQKYANQSMAGSVQRKGEDVRTLNSGRATQQSMTGDLADGLTAGHIQPGQLIRPSVEDPVSALRQPRHMNVQPSMPEKDYPPPKLDNVGLEDYLASDVGQMRKQAQIASRQNMTDNARARAMRLRAINSPGSSPRDSGVPVSNGDPTVDLAQARDAVRDEMAIRRERMGEMNPSGPNIKGLMAMMNNQGLPANVRQTAGEQYGQAMGLPEERMQNLFGPDAEAAKIAAAAQAAQVASGGSVDNSVRGRLNSVTDSLADYGVQAEMPLYELEQMLSGAGGQIPEDRKQQLGQYLQLRQELLPDEFGNGLGQFYPGISGLAPGVFAQDGEAGRLSPNAAMGLATPLVDRLPGDDSYSLFNTDNPTFDDMLGYASDQELTPQQIDTLTMLSAIEQAETGQEPSDELMALLGMQPPQAAGGAPGEPVAGEVPPTAPKKPRRTFGRLPFGLSYISPGN